MPQFRGRLSNGSLKDTENCKEQFSVAIISILVTLIPHYIFSPFIINLFSRKMSGWDAYINSITGKSDAIKRAAIVGLSDGAVWARTEAPNVFAVSFGHKLATATHFRSSYIIFSG